MMWQVIGAVALCAAALVGWTLAVMHVTARDTREKIEQERAERRALRRLERRQSAYTGRHTLAPWPGPEPLEQLATTDQLRALAALAESGDIAEIQRQNAAWWRVNALKRWVRAA